VTGDLIVRAGDPLDVEEARRIVTAVEALRPGGRVHVDLFAVRDLHPTGLAALAGARARGNRVTMGGLSRQHQRLLDYLLGVGPRASPAHRPWGEEPAEADAASPDGNDPPRPAVATLLLAGAWGRASRNGAPRRSVRPAASSGPPRTTWSPGSP